MRAFSHILCAYRRAVPRYVSTLARKDTYVLGLNAVFLRLTDRYRAFESVYADNREPASASISCSIIYTEIRRDVFIERAFN